LYSDFIKVLKGCPFCDGYNRIIAETDTSFLTYALAPYHKHHLLVIPKRHVTSRSLLTQAELQDIYDLEDKALTALQNLGYVSISFLLREGPVETKSTEGFRSVSHTHFHVIPNNRIGDLDNYGQPRSIMTDVDIADTVRDIQKALRVEA